MLLAFIVIDSVIVIFTFAAVEAVKALKKGA